jgi:PleD family two-component response regulator
MNDHILIIEANTTKLRKLREILSKEGFNIMTVTDKKSALNICKKIQIEYVIANPNDLGLTKLNYKTINNEEQK